MMTEGIHTDTMDIGAPFIPPVERPKGLMMKLLYFFTRRQFGKVLNGLGVYTARMPVALAMFGFKAYGLDKKLVLKEETAMLVRQRVASINVCSFCMDSGRYFAIKKSMNMTRFDALNEYETNPLFSDAERAALDDVTEPTRNKKVNPDTFSEMRRYYSEREICEIVYIIATEHMANMTNIGLNIHSEMLCSIAAKES